MNYVPQQDFAAQGRPFDTRALLDIVRDRSKLFLALVLAVLIATLVVTLRTPPLYMATATVLIDTRSQRLLDSQAVLSGLPADAATVDTEVELLRSRQLADRVVRALTLDEDAEFDATGRELSPGEVASLRRHEAVVDAVQRRLEISRVGLTYVMNIGFNSSDPEKAARIANAFAETYLRDQQEAKLDATQQANGWLGERLDALRAEVIEGETAVEQYRSANGLMSASGATLTEQEISGYNTQLATVRAQQAEDEARLSTARAQLADGSTGDDVGEALQSTVVQQLRTRRAEVSGRVADLTSRYGPRHPDRQRAEGELADVDAQIQAEIVRIVSNLEARVQVARQRTASMQASLGGARRTLALNNSAGVRLNELERNAEASRTLYQALLDRYKQTTSQAGLATSDARIVSRATVPVDPTSPDIGVNLMLGLILALGAGAAGVALAEYLSPTPGARFVIRR
ncbi:MAG: GumC family protein [Pseudomonadota bacterium]